MSEPLMGLLADLPSADVDRVRADRIRRRCHARLARRASRLSGARASVRRFKPAEVWQPLVALLGAAYMTDVIVQAIHVYFLP
jgi:hypothetical protein